MKKNIFNKEEQNLFAWGGPYGMPYGIMPSSPLGKVALLNDLMEKRANDAKKIQSQPTKQTNINAGVSSKLFAEGGETLPADNTHVNNPIFLPIERQRNFSDLDYFWDSGSRFPAGFWRQKDGSFRTTNPANGEPLTYTQEEVDSIVRANTAKGRKERLKKAMESKFSYGGLMNDNPTLFTGEPKNIKAIGGDIQTNGSDWSTGATHINNGGSHEESPYDGVQIGIDSEGVPNLVEEGEVIFNEYVYSKRINLDEDAKKRFHFPRKTELSYADAAKKLEKEVKERPNDPISRASFKAQMEQLADEQERQKQEMEAERAKEAFEALSPEEQTALMQQKAQQDAMAQQQAQEQAIAEQQGQPSPEEMAAMEQQAAIQQQMSPEEAAMMQQQMAAQQGGMPAEGVVPEGYAYGGELDKEINIFDLGGLAWIKKNHPEVKNPEAVAKALEKMMQANRSNYYRPSSTGTSGGLGNYEWQFEDAWTEMVPATTSLSAAKNHFDKWLKYGLDRENAFNVTHSNKLYTQYMGEAQKAHKRDYDNQYNELVKKYAEEERLKAEKQEKISAAVDEYFKNPQEFLAKYNPNYIKEVQQAAQEQVKQQANSSTVPSGGTKALSQDKYSVSENTVVNPLANVTSKYRLTAPEDQYKVENGQIKFWRVGKGDVAYPSEEAARNASKSNKKAGEPAHVEKAAETVQRPSIGGNSASAAAQVTPTREKGNTVAANQFTEDLVSEDINWKDFANRYNAYTASRAKGNILGHYAPDARFNFGEYGAQDIKELENSQEYRNFTKYIEDHPDDGQVQAYLHALDDGTHEGVEKLFGKDGKLKSNWQKLYKDRRTDGIAGIYHLNPFMVADTFSEVADTPEAIAASKAAVDADNAPLQEAAQPETATRAANGEPEAAWNAGDPKVEKNVNAGRNPDGSKPEGYGTSGTQPIPKEETEVVPNLLPETNYGLLGSAVPLFMQLARVGEPDFAAYDRLAAQANRTPHLAHWMPRGDFATLKYPDPWFYTSPIIAQSNATQRAITNKVSPSSDAASIANGYNTMIALGNAQKQQDDTLFDRYMKTKQYNGTIYDANQRAHDANSQFNAQVLNHADQFGTQLGLSALSQKDDANRWWASNLYGNVNAITNRVNQWEKWKRDHNTIAKMAADSLFGNISDKQYTGLGYLRTRPKTSSAEGGSVKRKKAKKKRGFTI